MSENDRAAAGPLRRFGHEIAKRWYEARAGSSRQLGIPTTGLIMAEHLRRCYPLTRSDFLTPKGGQVARLSGRSGDRIVRNFVAHAPPLGTESGRTSRGTIEAAEDFANIVNNEPRFAGLNDSQRAEVCAGIQEWLVNEVFIPYWRTQRLEFEFSSVETMEQNIARLLDAASQKGVQGVVAQHLVGAKLQLRFPEIRIENHSYSTADAQTGRHGDFTINETVFHVTVAPSENVLRRCNRNLADNLRPVLLVPFGKVAAARQMAELQGIATRVWITSIEQFVAQNLDELGEFVEVEARKRLRALLEVYNSRVEAAEPNPGLLIRIPENL